MPTMRMTEGDRNWSVAGSIRSDAPELTCVVERQTNARALDGTLRPTTIRPIETLFTI
jgi:hypothetical protein